MERLNFSYLYILASITSEAVKEKAKHSVLFYRVFLAAKFTDSTSAKSEIVLGNLLETFLAAINTGRSKGIQIFTNVFATYRKDRLHSYNFLDTAINFPHTNRTMISSLMLGDYRSIPLDEDTEYLLQTISIHSFLICMSRNRRLLRWKTLPYFRYGWLIIK